jgi:hypothetical protein
MRAGLDRCVVDSGERSTWRPPCPSRSWAAVSSSWRRGIASDRELELGGVLLGRLTCECRQLVRADPSDAIRVHLGEGLEGGISAMSTT